MLCSIVASAQTQTPVCDTRQKLCQLLEPADRESTNLHGVVVEMKGKIAAQRYYTGRDRLAGEWLWHTTAFDADTLHDGRSVSKSMISLLVGIAIAEGKIPSIDTPIINYADGYKVNSDPRWAKITLRHLLTMSSGMDWNESGAISISQAMESLLMIYF